MGCLGVVSSRIERYLNDLDTPDVLGGMQTSTVVGTTNTAVKRLRMREFLSELSFELV